MTLTEDELYELFISVDDRVRQLTRPSAKLLALRERLLPIYSARHARALIAADHHNEGK